MFKGQNILSVVLIVLGVLGFKWNDAIGSMVHSVYRDTPATTQIASSLSNKLGSAISGEPSAFYVELFSIAMMLSGVLWLLRRASTRSSDNRVVLDFSKKK